MNFSPITSKLFKKLETWPLKWTNHLFSMKFDGIINKYKARVVVKKFI